MDLLLFKLFVTPSLLLLASLAVRRWGEAVGGLLVGMPLTSGPVSVFLALEHGPAFATQATAGSLVATIAQVAFCVIYCRLAAQGWRLALTGAAGAFVVVAALLQWSALPEMLLFLLALIAITLALNVMPNTAATSAKVDAPWWDLPLRMVLIAALIVSVTLIAPYVGASAAGVIASFPFMAIILAVFAHRASGAAAAQQVMRGMATGLIGFAAFFFVLSLLLTHTHLVVAYGSAILCTLAIQAMSFYRMRSLPAALPVE
ncbi:hypothetical protein [Paraburkholderia bannensis]|uniref:hypothetical protein n=1 Tax=Paraburkholderia bannensis TaxID=765414 RepID=UPI002AB6DA7C|nr:hypothetical protein [Paraburkholderia bannensis]